MNLLKHSNGIRIALFATFLLFSQSLMAEWDMKIDWQYPNVGNGLGWSIALHPNDSILAAQEGANILFFNTNSGSITKSVPYTQGYITNLTYSDDGSLISTNNKYAGILGVHNAETFEYIFKQDYPNIINQSFNSKLKMIVGCGVSSIKIYDIEQKKLIKEYTFESGLFASKNSLVTRVKLLNNKSIVYTYSYSVNNMNKSRVCMIDSLGKLILDEESYNTGIDVFYSCLFAISNDNKILAFCTPDAKYIQLYNLSEMELITTIADSNGIGGSGYFYLRFTYDDKLLMIGYWNGLYAYNFEKQKTIVIRNAGGFHNFQNPKDYYSTMYSGSSNVIYRLRLSGLTDVPSEKEQTITIQPQPVKDNIFIKANFDTPVQFSVNITNNTVELLTNIDNKFFNTGEYNLNYSTTKLSSGIYYLIYTLNNKPQLPIKFIKVD